MSQIRGFFYLTLLNIIFHYSLVVWPGWGNHVQHGAKVFLKSNCIQFSHFVGHYIFWALLRIILFHAYIYMYVDKILLLNFNVYKVWSETPIFSYFQIYMQLQNDFDPSVQSRLC
jgi:hypothetical protein